MKRAVFLILILCAGFLSAEPFDTGTYSVALTDDLRAVEVNPAALSFGAASGIGFLQDPGDIFGGAVDVTDNFNVFLGRDGFAWMIGKEGGIMVNQAALSLSPFKNIYTGAGFGWRGRDLADYTWAVGVLARPVDALSIGAVYRDNAAGAWTAGFGLGIRPLWLVPGLSHRLALAADLEYGSGGLNLPVIHLEAEPVDGIFFRGSYDTGAGTFSAGLGLGAGHLFAGARSRYSADGSFQGFHYYAQAGFEKHRSVFSPRPEVYIDYAPGPVLREHPGISLPGFSSIGGTGDTVRDTVEEIRRLAGDESVRGLVFRNVLFQATRTNLHELGDALLEFKATGKTVVFYYEDIDTLNYTLAARVADAIYMHPLGALYLAGTGSVRFYYGDLLKRLGIETVDLQSHEYKTANNSITKSTMTDAEREALLPVLEGLQAETERTIADGREGRLSAPVRELFDHGPYLVADEALDAGLVDGLLHESELDDRIMADFPEAAIRGSLPEREVRRDWSEPWPAEIALVHATGPIYSGEGFPGDSIGSDTLVRALRQARDNPVTKAILLRVDSPGGSALASDSIAREIEICRSEPCNLPVVVSMGQVAGSGGYYISCTADYIVAHPDTITGSIGVAGFNINLEGLLEKIDVEAVSLFTREKSDLGGGGIRESTEEEIAIFRAYISHVYEAFVDTVARGRGMSREDVHAAGQGRIWTGTQALELGLIDETGSFDDAVAKAKELAGIEGEITLKRYDGYVFDFEDMMPLYLSALVKNSLPAVVVELAAELEALAAFDSDKPLLMVPWRF